LSVLPLVGKSANVPSVMDAHKRQQVDTGGREPHDPVIRGGVTERVIFFVSRSPKCVAEILLGTTTWSP
jgi:hypothetical protein